MNAKGPAVAHWVPGREEVVRLSIQRYDFTSSTIGLGIHAIDWIHRLQDRILQSHDDTGQRVDGL